MSRGDDSGSMYAGGVIVFVVLSVLLVKVLKKIFLELGLMFEAFGKMLGQFLFMLWELALMAGLLAIGIGLIYAAWYFTIRYYKMVKAGTAVQENLERGLADMASQLNNVVHDFRRSTNERLKAMEEKLSDALDKKDLAPPPVVAVVQVLPSPKPLGEIADVSEVNENPNPATNQEIEEAPKDISNPF